MKTNSYNYITLNTVAILLIFTISYAEIITDGSINKAREINGPNYYIKESYGKTCSNGTNLFHSFQTFNVYEGEQVHFLGNDSIQNIISRVTGGEVSTINGLIRSEIPNANLYFINPSGIVFGQHASIDLDGSFHVSTADFLGFGNNHRFNAIPHDNEILYTENPLSFGFIDHDFGKIIFDNDDQMNTEINFDISSDNLVSIIGGDIEIQSNVSINAPGNNLNFVSLSTIGEFPIKNLTHLDLTQIEGGNISIHNNASIDVSANQSGSINIIANDLDVDKGALVSRTGDKDGGAISIYAKNVLFKNGARIDTTPLGAGKGSAIYIYSLDKVHFFNTNEDSNEQSIIHNNYYDSFVDNMQSGDILINAKNIIFENGALVDVTSYENVNAGKLTLIATEDVLFSGSNNSGRPTGISIGTLLGKTSADLLIDANNITFNNGAKILSPSFLGEGCHISLISKNTILFSGENPLIDYLGIQPTCLFFQSYLGANDPGSIYMDATSIIFTDGAFLSSSTEGQFNGANIELYATDFVQFTGKDSTGAASLIQIDTTDMGDAGHLLINSNKIMFQKGAYIAASSYGEGSAANIILNANKLISFTNSDRSFSEKIGIISDAKQSGNAGEISLSAEKIYLSDYCQISTLTKGEGDAGNIAINTDSLIIDHGAIFSLSYENQNLENPGDTGSININSKEHMQLKNALIWANSSFSGGGKVNIQSNESLLFNDCEISTSVAIGENHAGDINIDGNLTILKNSSITANAYEGDGGAIFIKSEHFLKDPESIIIASSDRGNDGEVRIEAPDLNLSEILALLPSDYLDASKWAKTPCDKRSGENSSHLWQIYLYAIPTSYEDWLPAPPIDLDKNHNPIIENADLYVKQADLKSAITSIEKSLSGINKSDPVYIQTIAYLSYLYQTIGFHSKAVAIINQVNQDVDRINDETKALYYLSFSDLLLSIGSNIDSQKKLEIVSKYTEKLQDPILSAMIFNNKGINKAVNEAYHEVKDYQQAIEYFHKSLELISQTDQPVFWKSKVMINLSHAYFLQGDIDEAFSHLDNAQENINTSPDGYYKVMDLLSLASLSMKILKAFDVHHSKFALFAFEALNDAKHIAQLFDNKTLLSCAYGQMAKIYAFEKRDSEAIQLAKKAIFYAQKEKIPEISYEWQWDLARLHRKHGNIQASLDAYQDAIQTLHPVRHAFFRGYRSKALSFYRKVRPVYLEYAELLFAEAQKSNDQQLLITARDNIESLKELELQDYYQDECLTITKTTALNITKPETALIYPISFPDHLVLLLTLPNGMKQVSIPVSSEKLNETIHRFHKRLWQSDFKINRINYFAQVLYDWLVKPIASDLDSHHIETLFISPDGILRSIPFCVLHDGNDYLVKKYAIVTIPAITLTDSQPVEKKDFSVLLGGLSESRFNFNALPCVEKEINGIAEYLATEQYEKLLNQDFTIDHLKDLLQNNLFSTIHMATHAQFNPSLENTFLLTYDNKMTMRQLKKLMEFKKYQKRKIDLLTLSACQTALGDERALLGFAGIALKAGVKSAIASLWNVNDLATSLLMKKFYYQLIQVGLSKAKALQYAQNYLIEQNEKPKYKHPIFWAPFLFIEG